MGVDWWLLAPAFVLGAVLTSAFTVRRLRREVPMFENRRSAGAAILDGDPPPAD